MSKKEKNNNKGMFLISILVTICLLLVGAITFMVTSPDETKQIIASLQKSDEEFYSKPVEFIAEVQKGEHSKTYMNAVIVVSANREKDIEVFNNEEAKLLDSYISYFSQKSVEELKSSEGQNRVKEELITLIEDRIGKEVAGVYFTKWIFQ